MSLFKSIRYGVRRLVGSPFLSAIAVLALALGIALTTTAFSIVYGGIIRGLPFDRSDQIMHLEETNPGRNQESLEVPLDDFMAWREQQRSFSILAAYFQGTVNLTGSDGRPERYSGSFSTPGMIELTRVNPILGRTFSADEEGPGAAPVIILGYRVWQDRFGGDRDVLNRQIRANGREYTVIGVMPEGFRFPATEDLWLPLTDDPNVQPRRTGRAVEVVGRLRDGVSQDLAMTEFTTIMRRLEAQFPVANKGYLPVIKPFTEEFIDQDVTAMLYTMLGAVIGVLLIACANVANLLLARAAARSKEIAVRTALGASRLRILLGLLGESVLLSVAGGVLGLAMAYGGVAWFNAEMTQWETPVFWINVTIDPAVLLFVTAAVGLSALVAGFFPALQASGAKVNEVLKDEARGSSGFRLGRFSRGMVVFEVAMSCALLVASGLMIKSVVQLREIPFQFQTEGVITSRVGLFEGDYPDTASRQRFFEESLRQIASLPGVSATGYASALPASFAGRWRFGIDGEAYPTADDYPATGRVAVTPGFFGTFGVVAVRGRLLDERDRSDGLPVAVVNESFVDRFFKDREVLGARIRVGGPTSPAPWREIVGVVPDLHVNGVENQNPDGLYIPLAQSDARFMSLVAATEGDPTTLVPGIRRSYLAVDPNLPIYNVRTMDAVIALDSWFYGTFGTLFIVFGAVALFMAALGLYGVMAFSVNRRQQEIGVRMALGAGPRDVLRLVLRQGLVQLGSGLVLGLLLAMGLAKTLTVVLYNVQPGDPVVYVLIILTLLVTGTVASFLPSRRATRVDPLIAMRAE